MSRDEVSRRCRALAVIPTESTTTAPCSGEAKRTTVIRWDAAANPTGEPRYAVSLPVPCAVGSSYSSG